MTLPRIPLYLRSRQREQSRKYHDTQRLEMAVSETVNSKTPLFGYSSAPYNISSASFHLLVSCPTLPPFSPSTSVSSWIHCSLLPAEASGCASSTILISPL